MPFHASDHDGVHRASPARAHSSCPSLTGDGRRLPGIGWTRSLSCRRRDPSPDACLSSGCPRISLSIFCLLSMRAAPHHARTRASWKRAQGPGSRRPPRWGGGSIVGCVTCGWRSDSTHERARVLPLFPVPAGVRPPQFSSSHTFGPRSAVSLPPSSASQWSPPPPPQIAALQPLQEDPPTPGWFAIPRPCFPARFPAPLHHQRRPASRYPGVLRYRGTSFFWLPISLALLAWERCCMRRRSSDQRRVDQRRLD